MEYNIQGKTAFVTGSANGCGRAIAKMLAAEGATVILHDLIFNEEKLKEVSAELHGSRYLIADLSKEEEIEEMWRQVGDIDILVNNAGIWPTAFVKDMTAESFRKTLEINLIAPFLLCRGFLNQCMEQGKKGKIVNMVSQAAFHGSTSGHAHYASSKAALVGFTISLAREAAPYGLNVNAVAPGIIRTPMMQNALDVREDQYIERIPMRRVAEPEDVAKAVTFLCSSSADYITGATIDATGGMLMR